MSFPQCLITGHVNYKFPEPDTAVEETRWSKIQTKLNNKCRDTEKALKKEAAERALKKEAAEKALKKEAAEKASEKEAAEKASKKTSS